MKVSNLIKQFLLKYLQFTTKESELIIIIIFIKTMELFLCELDFDLLTFSQKCLII